MADRGSPEVTARRGSLALALLVGPLAIANQAWLAVSSFPLLGNAIGRTWVGWIIPGLLAALVAPRGRRLVCVGLTAVLLTLLIVPRTGYFGKVFLVAVPLATLLAAGVGALLARFARPLPPRATLAATLVATLAIGGWLVESDKVATILLYSSPVERDRDRHALLFVPNPAERLSGLIAIAKREAAAGRQAQAKIHLEAALRAAAILEVGRDSELENIADAQVQAGLLGEAQRTLAFLPPEERAWHLAVSAVRAGRFAQADIYAADLAPDRRFELLRSLGKAQCEANQPALARATATKLGELAFKSQPADKPMRYRDLALTLLECGFTDAAVAEVAEQTPGYRGEIAGLAQRKGKTALAQRLRDGLPDAGPR